MEDAIFILNTIRDLDDSLTGRLTKYLKLRRVGKNEYLLKAGELASDIYFIATGLVGVCYKDRHETIFTSFRTVGDVIISDKHFFGEWKSEESILALQNSFVYSLSYRACKDICKDFPAFNYHIRILVQRDMRFMEERLKAVQIGVWWRYQRFANVHPEIFRKVPNKYLASYLNTSIRNLQRIKKEFKYYDPNSVKEERDKWPPEVGFPYLTTTTNPNGDSA